MAGFWQFIAGSHDVIASLFPAGAAAPLPRRSNLLLPPRGLPPRRRSPPKLAGGWSSVDHAMEVETDWGEDVGTRLRFFWGK